MDLDIELLALLKCKGGGGGASVSVEPLTITENGTTTAPEGTAYSPVTVDVPNPSAGELKITENGTYDVMEKASAVVKVPQYLGYLTFQNIAYITVETPVWDGTMYISDDAEQWTEWDGTRFEPGDSHTIYLRGSGNKKLFSNGHSLNFEAYNSNAGGVTCDGNVELLLDAPTVARGEHPAMSNFCYACMFKDCTSLTKAPKLSAIALKLQCYYAMFQGCTSLVTAPELPATTLASNCYLSMFSGCTSLTTAPVLPASTLASQCYSSMFSGCTSLTAAPKLLATELAGSCYVNMFYGCTSLATPPALPATTLAAGCYGGMFSGCTGLITLPALPAITLAKSCYGGMFRGCTNIKLSIASEGDYTTPYRIPSSGSGTLEGGSNALLYMFDNTGGTFKGTPTINTTYYTANTVA